MDSYKRPVRDSQVTCEKYGFGTRTSWRRHMAEDTIESCPPQFRNDSKAPPMYREHTPGLTITTWHTYPASYSRRARTLRFHRHA